MQAASAEAATDEERGTRVEEKARLAGQAVFSQLIASRSENPAEIAPYVHTPEEVIETFFAFAGFQTTDGVVEIGSGDGRLLVELARRGVEVTGFEIDQEAIQDCRVRMEALAATHPEQAALILVRPEDAFTADLDWAAVDVVYAYITPRGLKLVWSSLVQRLRPGTRIITIQFQLPSATIHRQETFAWVDHTNRRCEFTFFEYVM